jgi:hypothetical protein
MLTMQAYSAASARLPLGFPFILRSPFTIRFQFRRIEAPGHERATQAR